MAISLPSWIDSEFLRGAAAGVAIAAALTGLFALVVVRGIFRKVLTLVFVAALAGGALVGRTRLDRCIKNCSCQVGNLRLAVTAQRCHDLFHKGSHPKA